MHDSEQRSPYRNGEKRFISRAIFVFMCVCVCVNILTWEILVIIINKFLIFVVKRMLLFAVRGNGWFTQKHCNQTETSRKNVTICFMISEIKQIRFGYGHGNSVEYWWRAYTCRHGHNRTYTHVESIWNANKTEQNRKCIARDYFPICVWVHGYRLLRANCVALVIPFVLNSSANIYLNDEQNKKK